MAAHGQSLSHQGGMIREEAPRRMSPSLFQQDAQPRPVKYICNHILIANILSEVLILNSWKRL